MLELSEIKIKFSQEAFPPPSKGLAAAISWRPTTSIDYQVTVGLLQEIWNGKTIIICIWYAHIKTPPYLSEILKSKYVRQTKDTANGDDNTHNIQNHNRAITQSHSFSRMRRNVLSRSPTFRFEELERGYHMGVTHWVRRRVWYMSSLKYRTLNTTQNTTQDLKKWSKVTTWAGRRIWNTVSRIWLKIWLQILVKIQLKIQLKIWSKVTT